LLPGFGTGLAMVVKTLSQKNNSGQQTHTSPHPINEHGLLHYAVPLQPILDCG